MYFNHDEIEQLIGDGYMQNTDHGCINAASLDVRLGDSIFLEQPVADDETQFIIDYSAREKLKMTHVRLDDQGIAIAPGQFFLAHTLEICNFPNDLAALFRIKSSQGRIGLEHMDAGWVDPGFHGALTLEFKNMTQHHTIWLRPGDKIGQLVFLRGNPVSEEKSYRTKGNYNGSTGVKQIGFKGDESALLSK